MNFDYAPPVPAKPMHKLLGEILLKDKKYASAYIEYPSAWEGPPNRTRFNARQQ